MVAGFGPYYEVLSKQALVRWQDPVYLAKQRKSRKSKKLRWKRQPLPDGFKQDYFVPNDINKFIEIVYPNMRAFVAAYIPVEHVDEVISFAVCHMLEFGWHFLGADYMPRWTTYRNLQIPYYKWWFEQLAFIIRSWLRDHSKEGQVLEVQDEEYFIDPTDELYLKQLEKYLSKLSKLHAEFDGWTFEANSLVLFQMRMMDYSNWEIAKKLGISTSATNQRMAKLQMIVRAFLADDWEQLKLFMLLGVPKSIS